MQAARTTLSRSMTFAFRSLLAGADSSTFINNVLILTQVYNPEVQVRETEEPAQPPSYRSDPGSGVREQECRSRFSSRMMRRIDEARQSGTAQLV